MSVAKAYGGKTIDRPRIWLGFLKIVKLDDSETSPSAKIKIDVHIPAMEDLEKKDPIKWAQLRRPMTARSIRINTMPVEVCLNRSSPKRIEEIMVPGI